MKKNLKYTLFVLILTIITNFYRIDISATVTSEDLEPNYGIACEYTDSNGDEHYFTFGTSAREFDHFEVIAATGLDTGTYELANLSSLESMKTAGIYVEETGKLVCPNLFLNSDGGMTLNSTNDELTLESFACNPENCVFFDIPNGEESMSCSYQSQSSNKTIFIKYSYTSSDGEKWIVTYPDGKEETLSGNIGTILPTTECSDIYYIESKRKIESGLKGNNGAVIGLCEEYKDDEIEHFCSGECDYSTFSCSNYDYYNPNAQFGGCFVCGNTYFPTAIATLVRNLYNLVKLLVPVIIIITGMVDLLKSVMASDEKKMEEAKPKLIKKLIAGITIFLIFAIVQFVFKNILGHNGALSNSLFDCVTYFISEEPEGYVCPTREDNINEWINEHTNNSTMSVKCEESCKNIVLGHDYCISSCYNTSNSGATGTT